MDSSICISIFSFSCLKQFAGIMMLPHAMDSPELTVCITLLDTSNGWQDLEKTNNVCCLR